MPHVNITSQLLPSTAIFKHFRNNSVEQSRVKKIHGKDLNRSHVRNLSAIVLPSAVDLTNRMPVIYDQGNNCLKKCIPIFTFI